MPFQNSRIGFSTSSTNKSFQDKPKIILKYIYIFGIRYIFFDENFIPESRKKKRMSLFRQKKTSVTFWHAPQRAGATCYIMTVTPTPQWSEREETVQRQYVFNNNTFPIF